MKTQLTACLVLQCVGMAFAATPQFAALAVPTLSQPLTLTSSDAQVALLELYTSEGCSSCPPADQWLAQFRAQPGLWREVVPLAFHVDYWDYIGWHDRFASAAFSARQQRYAQSGNLSQVYTPGVLLRGAEWRHWTGLRGIPAAAQPRVGVLQLQLAAQGLVNLQWKPSAAIANTVNVNLTLLGFDLTTPVGRGENAGRELHHDFVVLGSSSIAMTREGDHYLASLALPKPSNLAPRYALAAWVTAGSNPTPIQAVGGWLADH